MRASYSQNSRGIEFRRVDTKSFLRWSDETLTVKIQDPEITNKPFSDSAAPEEVGNSSAEGAGDVTPVDANADRAWDVHEKDGL